LEYIQVPSRFVGTDTVLSPEVFNDNPLVVDAATGGDITGPTDPRYLLQPPFNKVSRQRDPGRVNLNTVTSRRAVDPSTGVPQIWSEVFDGIMHRYHDGNPYAGQLGHFGPAWRDVALSRRGYAQINADASATSVDQLGTFPNLYPDTLAFGLNPNFPTFVANPFRAPDAGDLVPLAQMIQTGVDVSWLRRHHYTPNVRLGRGSGDGKWGKRDVSDGDGDPLIDDVREAGFGDDVLTAESTTGRLLTDESRLPRASSVARASRWGVQKCRIFGGPATAGVSLITLGNTVPPRGVMSSTSSWSS
jgi:hypothetical protein